MPPSRFADRNTDAGAPRAAIFRMTRSKIIHPAIIAPTPETGSRGMSYPSIITAASPYGAPMSIAMQALSIYAVNEGYLDDVAVNKIMAFEEGLHAHFANTQGELVDKVNGSGNWNDEIEAQFKKGIEEFKQTGSW